ncbi:MAG TPA: ATP-binding protein [Pilimelia sp.]|nr:ATP-binding protein [Pilimelia sp.]
MRRRGVEGGPPRRRGQAVLLAAAVVLLGLTASGVTVALLQRQQQRHAAETLDRHTDLVHRAVVGETRRYEDALRDLAAALAAQENLTAADFAAITSAVTRERLSGATGVSFAVPTQPGQLAGVQAAWRRQGSTGLRLRPAATGRPEHRFAVVSRSLDPGTSVLGRDLTESQQSVEAMNLARRTGAPAASHTYVLLRDRTLPAEQRQLSFQLAAPVRVRAAGRAWDGWLIMAMRGRDFLAQTLRQVALGQVRVLLLDEDRAGVPSTPVATWPARAPGDATGRAREVHVPVAQRNWTLLVRPTAALGEGAFASVPLLAGAAGVLVTALLSGLVLVLGWSRERALGAVAEATAALHADIARREAVEARLRRREAELRGFAGVAAHDLKAPLAVTGGRLELLEDELGEGLSPTASQDLARARAGLARMDRLISDLLAYATADEAEPRRERVDLGALVAEVLAERSGAAAEPPAVTVGALPTVVGDLGMLRQLLGNLVGNALKYVAPGQRPAVTVTAAAVPGGWRVTVADRGIGIPADQRAIVFDAFQRADGARNYPGTGLGLAICHRIVERHGGAIGVVENPGGGSVFWFTLPADPVAGPPADPRPADARAAEPARARNGTYAGAG